MAESAAADTHKVPGRRLKALVSLLFALVMAGAPLHVLGQFAFVALAWSESEQREGPAAPGLGGDAAVSGDELGSQAAKLETPQQVRAADKKASGPGAGPQAAILRPGGIDPPSERASRDGAMPVAPRHHRIAPYILPSPTGPPIFHA